MARAWRSRIDKALLGGLKSLPDNMLLGLMLAPKFDVGCLCSAVLFNSTPCGLRAPGIEDSFPQDTGAFTLGISWSITTHGPDTFVVQKVHEALYA